ncbi:Ras small GTPase, Ras type [Penicillium camemberti]|uniref:Ras small GTPase, Ras type n=1 Tax=Penicillium camemberti (strain FM 013) TaxID=1429867 RepID=A0A0G4P2R0_PENC3|nr:Ras small GTPase, Ras type [Penicillium camemberti]
MQLCGRQKVVQRKMVLLGDGACGKTSALNVFTRGFFPTVYEPTVFGKRISSSTTYMWSSRYGIPPAKKSSTDCERCPTRTHMC